MSTIPAAQSNRFVRVSGLLAIIAGAVFLLAGGVTWGAVSSNLKAENISVSPDAKAFGGQVVDTPWEAFAQADIINTHALHATEGKTYAEVSGEAMALKDQLTADGATADEIAANPELTALNGQKATVMNGSFLRASLFTSVVAYGVALFAAGMGVLAILFGWAIHRLAAVPVVVKRSGLTGA